MIKIDEAFEKIKNREHVILNSKEFNILSRNFNGNINYEIILRINYYCNLNCIFCFVNKKEEVDEEIIYYLIKKMEEINDPTLFYVQISGGEPTINPKFFEYLSRIYPLVFQISLQTNAIVLHKKIYKKLLNYQDKLVFFVGFLSLNKYNYLTLSGSKNEKNYFSFIKSLKKLSENFKVILNVVPNQINANTLEDDIDFISKNFNYKNITILFSLLNPNISINKSDHLMISYSQYVKLAKEIKSLCEKIGIDFRFTEGSGCGIPLCILSEFNKTFITPLADYSLIQYIDEFDSKKDIKTSFVKLKNVCDRCKYDRFCQGISSSYYQRFGFDEIKYYFNKFKLMK